MCVYVPWRPSTFSPKNLSPTSVSSLQRGGRAGRKGVHLPLLLPFLLFYTLGCNTGPKASSKMPRVQSGARLHWVVGLSTGTWVSPRSFYLFSPISPSFTILKRRWSDALIPAARESPSLEDPQVSIDLQGSAQNCPRLPCLFEA